MMFVVILSVSFKLKSVLWPVINRERESIAFLSGDAWSIEITTRMTQRCLSIFVIKPRNYDNVAAPLPQTLVLKKCQVSTCRVYHLSPISLSVGLLNYKSFLLKDWLFSRLSTNRKVLPPRVQEQQGPWSASVSVTEPTQHQSNGVSQNQERRPWICKLGLLVSYFLIDPTIYSVACLWFQD